MKKTLISILLILCLAVGLLPVTALADNTAKILLLGSVELSVTEGGAPVYTKNKAFDAANAPDGSSTFAAWTQEPCDGTGTWNVKFEWPTGGIPTVTLKDAKFDYYDNDCETYAYLDNGGYLVSTANRTTSDLEQGGETDSNILVSAIMPVKDCPIDLKVVLKGNNLIETGSGFVLANVAIKENLIEAENGTFSNTYFKNLYFVGEGENNTVANCDGIGIHTRSGYDVSFKDVNLTTSTTAKGTNAIPIHVTKGNLTIDGGSINVTQSDRVAIWTQNSGDVIINSGSVTATGSVGQGPKNGIIQSAGKLIINGGAVNATPQNAVGLYGKNGIEINGGTVDILSPYYGINAGGEIVFNGGTTTITAKNAFHSSATIKTGTDVMAYAGASKKNAQIFDGSNAKLAQKPWMLITNDPDKFIELDEEEDDLPIFTLPTQTPTIPSAKPTTPTVKPTKATTSTRATRPTEATQYTEATKAPTQATTPISGTVTSPITTPTYSVNGDPVSTKPVATVTPDETLEETLAPTETLTPTKPLAPETSESKKAPSATKATEESKATKVTIPSKDKDSDKNKDENQKGPNAVLIIVLVVVVLAAAGGAAWFALRPKPTVADNSTATEEKTEE